MTTSQTIDKFTIRETSARKWHIRSIFGMLAKREFRLKNEYLVRSFNSGHGLESSCVKHPSCNRVSPLFAYFLQRYMCAIHAPCIYTVRTRRSPIKFSKCDIYVAYTSTGSLCIYIILISMHRFGSADVDKITCVW